MAVSTTSPAGAPSAGVTPSHSSDNDGGPELTDATDWLSTPLRDLSALDAALRCQICKDFFANAVVTSCSHTFCSLCIRRCLSGDGKCPACRAPDQATRLRCNWAVQEAVDAWVAARAGTLRFAREGGARVGAALGQGPKQSSSVSGVKRGSLSDSVPEGKRRLRDSTRARAVNYDDSTLAGDANADADAATTSPLTGHNDVPDLSAAAANGSSTHHSSPDTTAAPIAKEELPDDGLVPCPICNHRMRPALVFSHLDRCPGPGSAPPADAHTSTTSPPYSLFSPRKQRLSSTTAAAASSPFHFHNPARSARAPASPPERLPALNYSILTDRALRQKMSALGISSAGPRALLQRRHTEWVNLWNANCDSRRPRPKRELLQELEQWERTQGATLSSGGGGGGGSVLAGGNGGAGGLGNGAVDVARKDFDKEDWARGHQESFRSLVEQARSRASKGRAKIGDANQPAVSDRQRGHEAGLSADMADTSPTSIPRSDPSVGKGLDGTVQVSGSPPSASAPSLAARTVPPPGAATTSVPLGTADSSAQQVGDSNSRPQMSSQSLQPGPTILLMADHAPATHASAVSAAEADYEGTPEVSGTSLPYTGSTMHGTQADYTNGQGRRRSKRRRSSHDS
ncbi:E3 ubiquitin-protein ligase rad18 [Ascosphaera acerosa]|nr:E3 ubiquitin-protein ligase rad18 [Ascosphaera acerosa]